MWRRARRVSDNTITTADNSKPTDPLLSNKDGAATVATSVNSDEQRDVWSSYGSSSGGGAEKKKNKPTIGQIFKSTCAILITAAGAVASILSFMVAPAIIVYVAGSICLMNFPMVTYKEKKLMMLPSRRKTVKQLEDTVELLQAESDYLEDEIEYLLGYAARYGDVEHELHEIAHAQGSNVDEIVELVRINEETMDRMRENLRQKVIQDVIGIVIRSDKHNHQIIDRVEAKLIALKISVKLEAYGVTFDEDKFIHAVALNPTLSGVAGCVRKLLPPVVDGDGHSIDGNVSVLSDKNDIYDMFYMSGDDNSQGGSTALDARAVSEGRRASLATRRQPNAASFEGRQRMFPSSRQM